MYLASFDRELVVGVSIEKVVYFPMLLLVSDLFLPSLPQVLPAQC
jgi:hypothetical protein